MALQRNMKNVNSLSFESDSSKVSDNSPRSVLAGHFSNMGSDKSITPVVSGENKAGTSSEQPCDSSAAPADRRLHRRPPFGIGRNRLSGSDGSESNPPETDLAVAPSPAPKQQEPPEASTSQKLLSAQERGSWKALFAWKKNSGGFPQPQEASPQQSQKGQTLSFSQCSNASSQGLSTASSEISLQRRRASHSGGAEGPSANQNRTFRRSLTLCDGKRLLGVGAASEASRSVSGGFSGSVRGRRSHDPKPAVSSTVSDSVSGSVSGAERKKAPLLGGSGSSGKKFSRWNSFSDASLDPGRRVPSAPSKGRLRRREEAEASKMAETLTLSLMRGSVQSKVLAVREIRVVTKFSAPARDALGLSGAIGLLLGLLSEVDWEPMEVLLLALCNMAIGNRRNKILMVEGGFLARMAPILKAAPAGVREACVAVVLSLASEEEHKSAIGKAGMIPFITRTLNSGSVSGRCDASHALHNLLGFEGNRGEILATQPIPGLLRVLEDCPEHRAAEKAAAVIYTFTAVEKGRQALVEAPTAVPALLAMAQKGSEKGRDLAVSSLFTVCSQSRRFCAAASKAEAGRVLTALGEEEEVGQKMRQKIARLVKCLDMVAASSAGEASGSAASRKVHAPEPGPVPSQLAPTNGGGGGSGGRNSALKDLLEESMRGALTRIKSRVNMS